MRRFLITLTALLGALVLPGPAQENHARSELFTREANGLFEAAVEIDIDSPWHLYHDDLGPDDAIGTPTAVTFGGADVAWETPVFPEPHRYDQEFGKQGKPTWIYGHEGFITVYAIGTPAPGASIDDVTASVSGLTCTDELCLPYSESDLSTSGAGGDSIWKGFPYAAFTIGGGGDAVEVPSAGGGAGGTGGPSQAAVEPGQTGNAEAELFTREEGGYIQAAVEIAIDTGWHLYHDDLGPEDAVGKPTEVTFGGADVDWAPAVFPEPHRFEGYTKAGEDTVVNGHEDFITVYARGKPGPGASADAVTVSIVGQTCTDQSCVDYVATNLPSSGAGSDTIWKYFPDDDAFEGSASSARPGSNTRTGDDAPVTRGVSSGADGSIWAFLGLAVFWGLFTLLMPCTYPMIPITISFFTKQAEENPSKQLLLSLTYGLGIVAIFILIGVAFSTVIIPFATHPITNIVIGIVFVVFALALFGMITLQPPAFLLSAAGKASMRGGLIGVFLMGTTLVVTSFTCTAPFVGSLLAAGASGGTGRIVLGMGVFGLTMAIPFVLLSMVPRKIASMPKAGEWMNVIKVFMGFVELAAALKFISNADLVWGWGILTRELFLYLWAAIFGIAAVFLFGMIRMKGESGEGIGPGRLVAATMTLLLATYCAYGVRHEMDDIMTAIIPPYSQPRFAAGGGGGGEEGQQGRRDHTIVKDDYDGAVSRAAADGKALLVNFTGHT